MAEASGKGPTKFCLPLYEGDSETNPLSCMLTSEVKEKFAQWPLVPNHISDKEETSRTWSDEEQQSGSSPKNSRAESIKTSDSSDEEFASADDVPFLSRGYETEDTGDRLQYINGRSLIHRNPEYAVLREVSRRRLYIRQSKVLTILHVRAMNANGHCVSGFIDLLPLVTKMPMTVMDTKFLPNIRQALSFYNFHDEWLILNNTKNFSHLPLPQGSPEIGFRCIKDNAELILSETGACKGVSRTAIEDPEYIMAVFYDHLLSR